MTRFKFMGAATAAILGLSSLTSVQAAEKVRMTMAAQSGNYAPYLVAIDKGYFAEEGFNVEVVKAGGGTATPALISGDVDVSTSGASALSAILKGAPLRLVFFPWDRPTYQIWSTNKDIKKLEDLKGKAVGILSRGDTFEVGTRLVLMRRGLNPNMIGYTPLGYGSGRIAAISKGSLPAAVLSRRDVEALRGSGALQRGNMLVDMYEEVRMPYTGIAVSAKAISSNRDRVKKILRACVKGFRYTAAHADPTIDILTKYEKKIPRAVLAKEYPYIIKSKSEDGTVTEAIQRQEAEMRAAVVKVAKNKIPSLNKIYDFSLVKEINAELDASGWKPAP